MSVLLEEEYQLWRESVVCEDKNCDCRQLGWQSFLESRSEQ